MDWGPVFYGGVVEEGPCLWGGVDPVGVGVEVGEVVERGVQRGNFLPSEIILSRT